MEMDNLICTIENKKEKRDAQSFFLGFAIYTFGYLLVTLELFPAALCQLCMIPGLILFINGAVRLLKIENNNKYFMILLFLLMLWHIITISRIESITYEKIKGYLFYPYFFLPYFVPLIALLVNRVSFVKGLFKYATQMGIAFLFLLGLLSYFAFSNQDFSEQLVWSLGTGCGFILLTWGYHSRKVKYIALAVVFLCLLTTTIMARRNIMLTFGNYLLFSLILYFFLYDKRNVIKKIVFVCTMFILSLIGVFYFIANNDSTFKLISERASENTRDEVLIAYFLDMAENDILIGKGIDGTYYCPGIDSDDIDDRELIECGYLQIILKGGIINLIIFLLILIPAIILGIGMSKNILCKAAGIIVFLWLMDMIPWGMPAMNTRYILLWVCVGLCYKKDIRMKSDVEIYDCYFNVTSNKKDELEFK